MDLPVQLPVDVYQIHRTPFFKRLHRIDSDQFERLKKAYESIRSFDEKPLQKKINRIRLDKLVLRISNSLLKSAENKPPPRPKPKSKQQIRFEEIAKARQLGIEYSRQKFNSTTRLIKPTNVDPKQDLVMKKSQLNRRLAYGNTKSKINRSKIKATQGTLLSEGKEFATLATSPTSAMTEKFRKLLVHYMTEDNPNPDVVNSFEEIAKTKNHLYWDLMGAIKKQQYNIRRYGKFTKMLSKITLKNFEPDQLSHEEVFQSKTNIRSCSSDVLIKTYRYSDDDENLPLPSESFLRIPSDFPDDDVQNEVPTRDEFEELNESNNFIKHSQLSLPNQSSTTDPKVTEKKFDLSYKFGDIIRTTVQKESAFMLKDLERAMKH